MERFNNFKKHVGGVIRSMNSQTLKNIESSKMFKSIGANPWLKIGAGAGLGLWLASKAISSRTQDQENY